MSESVSQELGESSDDQSALEDVAATRYGRRALMLAAATAGAGITVDLVSGTRPAGAADTQGKAVLLGQNGSNTNTATSTTQINTSSGDGLQANTSGDSGSHGVLGTSTVGTGVQGQTGGNGHSGVSGIDTSPSGGHGVYGRSVNGVGVYGENLAGGQFGVYGEDASQSGGYGVCGDSTNGYGVCGLTSSGDSAGVLGSDLSPGGAIGVQGSSTVGTGVFGRTKGGGPGVMGESITGPGVLGSSVEGNGVSASITHVANSAAALEARTAGTGSAVAASITNAGNARSAVAATTNGKGSGVYGESTNAAGSGVTGRGTNGATGLYGLSDRGVGVYATSTAGDAAPGRRQGLVLAERPCDRACRRDERQGPFERCRGHFHDPRHSADRRRCDRGGECGCWDRVLHCQTDCGSYERRRSRLDGARVDRAETVARITM